MMGHAPRSTVYKAYESMTSVIDFQAIARGLEEEDVTHLSSMRLGRQANAPTSISVAGFEEAKKDEEYVKLNESVISEMESLRAEYGTLAAAKTAGSRGRYDQLVQKRNSRLQARIEQIYRREYDEYFKQNDYCVPDRATDEGLSSRETLSTEPGDDDGDDEDLFGSDPVAREETSDNESDFEDSQESSEFLAGIDADLAEAWEADEEEDDGLKEIDTVHSTDPQAEACRLHGIFIHTQRYRAGSTRPAVPENVPYEDVFEVATDETLSAADQAAILIPFFSIMHPLDRFPFKWFPQRGTQKCSICKEDHAEKGWRSVYACAKAAAEREAQQIWDDRFSELAQSPCTFRKQLQGNKEKACDFESDNDVKKMVKHLYGHATQMKKDLTCTLGGGGHPNKSLQLDSVDSLIRHWISDHGYFPYRSPAQTLFFWCATCDDFIYLASGSAEKEAHCASHLPALYAQVKKYGYNGVIIGQRIISPILDPFLLHNPKLPAVERSFTYLGGIVQGREEGLRLRGKNARLREHAKLSFCPASKASGTDFVLCKFDKSMTPSQLEKHMLEIHGVDFSISDGKKKDATEQGGKGKDSAEMGKVATKKIDRASSTLVDIPTNVPVTKKGKQAMKN
jgi:Protein of unknown function (DUF3435)